MTALNCLKWLSPPEDLNLKQLTLKVVTLSELVSAARCSFLHQMDIDFCYFRNDGYVVLVPGLVKGSEPHKPHLEIFFPSFPLDTSLCVASYLKRYIDITSSNRNNSSSSNILFISYIKPHKVVKTSWISRWLKMSYDYQVETLLNFQPIQQDLRPQHWLQTVEFPYQIL